MLLCWHKYYRLALCKVHPFLSLRTIINVILLHWLSVFYCCHHPSATMSLYLRMYSSYDQLTDIYLSYKRRIRLASANQYQQVHTRGLSVASKSHHTSNFFTLPPRVLSVRRRHIRYALISELSFGVYR